MSNITDEYMAKMAEAIGTAMYEELGPDFGFVFIAVAPEPDGTTDFNYISNIQEIDVVKELMTEVVTFDETKQ